MRLVLNLEDGPEEWLSKAAEGGVEIIDGVTMLDEFLADLDDSNTELHLSSGIGHINFHVILGVISALSSTTAPPDI